MAAAVVGVPDGAVVAEAFVVADAAVVAGAAVVGLALPPPPELHPDRTTPTITVPNATGVRMFTLRAYAPVGCRPRKSDGAPRSGPQVRNEAISEGCSAPGTLTRIAGADPPHPEDADRPLNR